LIQSAKTSGESRISTKWFRESQTVDLSIVLMFVLIISRTSHSKFSITKIFLCEYICLLRFTVWSRKTRNTRVCMYVSGSYKIIDYLLIIKKRYVVVAFGFFLRVNTVRKFGTFQMLSASLSFINIYIHIFMRVHMCICVHIYVWICTYTHMYKYVCTYTYILYICIM